MGLQIPFGISRFGVTSVVYDVVFSSVEGYIKNVDTISELNFSKWEMDTIWSKCSIEFLYEGVKCSFRPSPDSETIVNESFEEPDLV